MREAASGTKRSRPSLAGFAVPPFLALLGACAAGTPQTTLDDGTHETVLPDPDSARIAAALERLLASCSLDSTAWAAGEDRWRLALTAPHLSARSPQPRRLQAAGRSVSWDAILLPLLLDRWPEHVLVRESGAVLAFTKYRPEPLADLLLDEGLDLMRMPTFAWLLEQARFVQAQRPAAAADAAPPRR